MRLTLLVLLWCPLGIVAAEPRRPNVLWISADDLAPYAMGCYGSKVAQTPMMDAFATSAVRFDRAFCNAPVCTASRQSFLTGRYPRSLGVTQLQTALPAGTPTIASELRRAGYTTAAIGKMHFNSNLKHGFDLRLDAPDHRKALRARGTTPTDPAVALLPAWKPFHDPARVWLNADVRPLAADADL